MVAAQTGGAFGTVYARTPHANRAPAAPAGLAGTSRGEGVKFGGAATDKGCRALVEDRDDVATDVGILYHG